jgi:predicted metal-dependent hydrolase
VAHEYWESVWLELEDPEKTFLQSLIQVAAALHHFQRGNQQGTKSLLKAALPRLEPYRASFGGILVTRLCEELRAWVQALEAGDNYPNSRFHEYNRTHKAPRLVPRCPTADDEGRHLCSLGPAS